MIQALKAEFRKLYTIRSTYVILAISLVLVIFFAFYVEGYKPTTPVLSADKLASESISGIMALAAIGALVAILNVTHEYRYNTIMYSLTASRSRITTLLAKTIAISVFAIVFSLFFATLSPIMTYAGIHLRGLHMVHQDIPIWSLVWRCTFVGWGYAMFALILATIIRLQAGAIAAIFLIPTTVETLIGLLLKNNAIYLPFTALNNVLEHSVQGTDFTYAHAATIAGLYLLGSWIISAVLFVRRDAN